MFDRTLTLEETGLRSEIRSIFWGVTALDIKSFRLDRCVRNLERRWPGKDKAQQHEFRLERMRVRHELEILKIDLEILERRASRCSKPKAG